MKRAQHVLTYHDLEKAAGLPEGSIQNIVVHPMTENLSIVFTPPEGWSLEDVRGTEPIVTGGGLTDS